MQLIYNKSNALQLISTNLNPNNQITYALQLEYQSTQLPELEITVNDTKRSIKGRIHLNKQIYTTNSAIHNNPDQISKISNRFSHSQFIKQF